MSRQLKADVALFGGGIAGLWTLAKLLDAGYSAVLFETQALGGVQTIASQGIIHGGTKYALTGSLSESARTIADMPELWRNAVAGEGELDLRGTRLLTESQYLWSSEGLLSRMTGFFASKAMRSRMTQLTNEARPKLFQNPAFKGSVYQLNEPVLDVPSLIWRLTELCRGHLFQIDDAELQFGDDARRIAFQGGGIELQTQCTILAAGRGNGALLERMGRSQPEMQLRPLHMVMLRGQLPPLHAHALGVSANPRLTVASYPLSDGRQVWSLGGEVAETGMERDSKAQIVAAKQELQTLLPWLDLSTTEWATYRVDRAEIKTAGGRRPDGCYVGSDNGLITLWPTKLAFAPRVAQEVETALQQQNITPTVNDLSLLQDLPQPPLAQPPWETAEWS